MEDASDLLPADVTNWLLKKLREFRRAGGHGFLQISIQHGHISACSRLDSDKYPFKDNAGDKPAKA